MSAQKTVSWLLSTTEYKRLTDDDWTITCRECSWISFHLLQCLPSLWVTRSQCNLKWSNRQGRLPNSRSVNACVIFRAALGWYIYKCTSSEYLSYRRNCFDIPSIQSENEANEIKLKHARWGPHFFEFNSYTVVPRLLSTHLYSFMVVDNCLSAMAREPAAHMFVWGLLTHAR